MNTQTSTEKLFIFNNFFKDQPGLIVYSIDTLSSVCPKPTPYKSVENLRPAFDLTIDIVKDHMKEFDHVIKVNPAIMNISWEVAVVKKLGGEVEVRKHAVTMDQIEQLIKAQWDGKPGVMLNNGFGNHFHVVGKNNELLGVTVFWDSKWVVTKTSSLCCGGRVFANDFIA